MVTLFADMGFSTIADLLTYFLTVAGVLVLHFLLTYSVLVRFLANLNPVTFYKKVCAGDGLCVQHQFQQCYSAGDIGKCRTSARCKE